MAGFRYVENARRTGLLKAVGLHGFLALMLVFSLILPLVDQSIWRGVRWDVVLGTYLLIAAPLLGSLGTLGGIWKAISLQARPVECTNSGVVFPTSLLCGKSRPTIPWDKIAAVGTDFDPADGKVTILWTVLLSLTDGQVLKRSYLVDQSEKQKLSQTLTALRTRVNLSDCRTALDLARRLPPSRTFLIGSRVLALIAPLSLAGALLVGGVRGIIVVGSPLLFGAMLVAVSAFSVPLWITTSWKRRIWAADAQ